MFDQRYEDENDGGSTGVSRLYNEGLGGGVSFGTFSKDSVHLI